MPVLRRKGLRVPESPKIARKRGAIGFPALLILNCGGTNRQGVAETGILPAFETHIAGHSPSLSLTLPLSPPVTGTGTQIERICLKRELFLS